MNELEKKAIEILIKSRKTRKPMLVCSKRSNKSTRHNLLLKNILIQNKKGNDIYISTIDVEMFKWTFEQHTKIKVKLVKTKYNRLYIIKLI